MNMPITLSAAPRAMPGRGAAPGSAAVRLIRAGALIAACALASFASARCAGPMNLDTMTLLPAAACLGAAAMCFGTVLACLQALRDA